MWSERARNIRIVFLGWIQSSWAVEEEDGAHVDKQIAGDKLILFRDDLTPIFANRVDWHEAKVEISPLSVARESA